MSRRMRQTARKLATKHPRRIHTQTARCETLTIPSQLPKRKATDKTTAAKDAASVPALQLRNNCADPSITTFVVYVNSGSSSFSNTFDSRSTVARIEQTMSNQLSIQPHCVVTTLRSTSPDIHKKQLRKTRPHQPPKPWCPNIETCPDGLLATRYRRSSRISAKDTLAKFGR